MSNKTANVSNMNPLLVAAEQGGYAVGAFSPRNTAMISAVLKAGQAMNSPLIVQIAEPEFVRHEVNPRVFADGFYRQMRELGITVPVALHLDHTYRFEVIQEAIDVGFTSVMIDASAKPLAENITTVREAVEYAHQYGVSVEAELGRIGDANRVESAEDVELYTDPDEAEIFVRETGVDALAISVGTVHGVYKVRQPTIDLARVRTIHSRIPAHLVLHGGSGVPAEMMREAIRLGVSKVNIATDLEMAALAALGRDRHLTDAEMDANAPDDLARARDAIEQVVRDKIQHYVASADHASTADTGAE